MHVCVVLEYDCGDGILFVIMLAWDWEPDIGLRHSKR